MSGALASGTDAREDLGPVLPHRSAVHAQARELATLASRAMEFSGTGAGADLSLALRQLDHMRSVLGVDLVPAPDDGVRAVDVEDDDIGAAIDG